jgi:hypothetical protein
VLSLLALARAVRPPEASASNGRGADNALLSRNGLWERVAGVGLSPVGIMLLPFGEVTRNVSIERAPLMCGGRPLLNGSSASAADSEC